MLVRSCVECCVQVQSQPNTGKTMINRSSAESHQDVLGLEHQPCESRLRNQGEGTTSGAPNSSLSAHSGGAIEKSEHGSSQHCMAGGRDTTGLYQERFRLHIRRNFPPRRGQRCTKTGLREAVLSPALEVFQDTTGSSPVQPRPISQLVWLLAGGWTRDLSYSTIFPHMEKGLFDVSLEDFMSPMLVSASFPSSAKRMYFSLKPRNPFIVIIPEKR